MYLHRREAYENLGEPPDTDRHLLIELGFGVRLIALAFSGRFSPVPVFPALGKSVVGTPGRLPRCSFRTV